MFDAAAAVLGSDPRIAYALSFGSTVRGTAHAASDLDAILDCLDFRPIEGIFTRRVLKVATGGR